VQPFRTLLEQKIRERRLTLEEFVEFAAGFAHEHDEPGTLGVRHLQRLITGRGPGGRPLGPVRPATARLLESIFGVTIDELLAPPTPAQSIGGKAPIRADDFLPGACEWLDRWAGWTPGTSRNDVESRAAQPGTAGRLIDRQLRRARVNRSQHVNALIDYYGINRSSHDLYRAYLGREPIPTTILSRTDWLDLACPLSAEHDRFAVGEFGQAANTGHEPAVGRALDRLVEAAVLNVRITDKPAYRLLSVDVGPDMISGEVGLAPFVEYALTMDLLEDELADALVAKRPVRAGDMPLRDLYLPDLTSVLDFRRRLCAGGVLGLCAVARPADSFRGTADYALLVQERSGQVLNAARRLAVIPKGFHEPLRDPRADARLGATLQREMEEELFGREEVDSTTHGRVAVPMHPSRLSEPMRWLLGDPTRLRAECTGFGLNLISGNYEFAGLIVIDDEEFWTRYGGSIEANWETSGLRIYSSMDSHLIEKLVTDDSWSNEGLFAFLQGLRRLREIGGARVGLPAIELTATGR
jgi:hypothetical protein